MRKPPEKGSRKVRDVTIGGRLRFGGSTSSSTAGVLACQWNIVPLKISVESARGSLLPQNIFSRKERKDRKEMKGGNGVSEANAVTLP